MFHNLYDFIRLENEEDPVKVIIFWLARYDTLAHYCAVKQVYYGAYAISSVIFIYSATLIELRTNIRCVWVVHSALNLVLHFCNEESSLVE